MTAFRIYYEDGSIFEGEGTEDAMNAPTVGALVVKQEAPCNEIGWSIRSGTFFTWEKEVIGEWGSPERWGSKDDMVGLSTYYRKEKGAQKVLVGDEVSDEKYQKAKGRAVRDGYLNKEQSS